MNWRVRFRPRQVPSWLRDKPIAHRGLHGGSRPENSLAAFDAAARSGYPIELDVHCSRDGQAIVFHDEDLQRLTGERGRLAERNADELGTLRLDGTDETIPTLSQVLDLVDGRVPILIEIKNRGTPGRLEEVVLAAVKRYPGEVAIQSFNPHTVTWFRRAAPELTRGLLASDFEGEALPLYQRFVLRRLLLAPLGAPDYIGYELRCLPYWAPWVARRLGVPLIAWTIQTPNELRRATRLADNYIFEGLRP